MWVPSLVLSLPSPFTCGPSPISRYCHWQWKQIHKTNDSRLYQTCRAHRPHYTFRICAGHSILSSSAWGMVQHSVLAPSTTRNLDGLWPICHPSCPKVANSPRPPARVRWMMSRLGTTTPLFIHHPMITASCTIPPLIMPHALIFYHHLSLIYRHTMQ